jgi:hypothetical protein
MMRRFLLLLVYLAVWQERGRYTVYPFVFATARAHWVDFATETRLFWVYIYSSSHFFRHFLHREHARGPELAFHPQARTSREATAQLRAGGARERLVEEVWGPRFE